MAKLHMDSLAAKSNRNAILRALNELPDGLNDTYDHAMERIKDEHKELAYQVFSWIAHSYAPLTLADLQYALAVQEGMTSLDSDDLDDDLFITSICAGLVEVYQASKSQKYKDVVGLVRMSLY
jgi:hypothetical protein